MNITLAADASSQAIDWIILRHYLTEPQKAVFRSFGSLKTTKKNYGQIDKNELGLILVVSMSH